MRKRKKVRSNQACCRSNHKDGMGEDTNFSNEHVTNKHLSAARRDSVTQRRFRCGVNTSSPFFEGICRTSAGASFSSRVASVEVVSLEGA